MTWRPQGPARPLGHLPRANLGLGQLGLSQASNGGERELGRPGHRLGSGRAGQSGQPWPGGLSPAGAGGGPSQEGWGPDFPGQSQGLPGEWARCAGPILPVCPQPCQTDEYRTLQTPPTWASSHHGLGVQKPADHKHREKTLALQTHDQGQPGPKNCTLPSQGRRLRVRGAQEGLSGNGAVGPGGSPDFWSHQFPAGLAGPWAGPKGQTREGTRGRGAGSPLGPAQQHLPVSSCPRGQATWQGLSLQPLYQPVPGAQRWGWCEEEQTAASSHGVRARQGPWQDGTPELPGGGHRSPAACVGVARVLALGQ